MEKIFRAQWLRISLLLTVCPISQGRWPYTEPELPRIESLPVTYPQHLHLAYATFLIYSYVNGHFIDIYIDHAKTNNLVARFQPCLNESQAVLKVKFGKNSYIPPADYKFLDDMKGYIEKIQPEGATFTEIVVHKVLKDDKAIPVWAVNFHLNPSDDPTPPPAPWT